MNDFRTESACAVELVVMVFISEEDEIASDSEVILVIFSDSHRIAHDAQTVTGRRHTGIQGHRKVVCRETFRGFERDVESLVFKTE